MEEKPAESENPTENAAETEKPTENAERTSINEAPPKQDVPQEDPVKEPEVSETPKPEPDKPPNAPQTVKDTTANTESPINEDSVAKRKSVADKSKASISGRTKRKSSVVKKEGAEVFTGTDNLAAESSNASIMKKLSAVTDSGNIKSVSTLRVVDGMGERPEQRSKLQVIKHMNSYRLESKHPFHRESVYRVIRDVIHAELENMNYEPIIFTTACAAIANEIRSRVKALGFDRYKLVCIVQICEKNRQSVNSVAKFLWDPERDNCTSYFYESSNFLASGAVFGLYYE